MKQKILIIFILLILSIPSVVALLHKGFFQSDDGEWMVIRFSSFHQTFREGQFPIRFLTRLNYSYGYPVSNFLYPGFMYMAEPIKLLGFGFINTLKIILGISMISSLFFCYLWLAKLFNKLPSVVGAIVYLYAPYHLFDIYTRGSVGEVLALAVVPFILWQIERVSLFWSAVGIGFLVVSHNSLALLFMPMLVGYAMIKIYISKSQYLKQFFLLSFAIGIGLSTFFWLPALYDLQYTKFSQVTVSNPFDYFASPMLLGIIFVLIFCMAIGVIFFKNTILKKQFNAYYLYYFWIIGVISILLSSRLSSVLWSIIPISFIQFPFRFLSVEILSAGFIVAFFLNILPKKAQVVTGIIVSFIVFIFSYQYLMPKAFFDKGEGFYSTNEDTTTVKNEYMPKWVQIQVSGRSDHAVEPHDSISYFAGNDNNMSFKVSAARNTEVVVQKVFFPGWKASIDGKSAKIIYNNPKGLITISVSSGDHIVHVYFEEGGLRLVSDALSVIGLIWLMLYYFFKKSFMRI